MKTGLPCAVLFMLAACHPADRSESVVTLKSDAITLPQETATLPASADIVTQNCTACHSPELILTQPPFKAETWQTEVAKMRTAYHASIDPKDDAKIVAALMALQAKSDR